MKLETKTWIITLLCAFMVAGSIYSYRWLLLNNKQMHVGKDLIDNNQQELRKLKASIDEYNSIAQALNNDAQLKKEYFSRKVSYHSEFGRDGVEKIDDVLQATYEEGEGFFELKKFSLKHKPLTAKDAFPEITLVIEGEKRLEKHD